LASNERNSNLPATQFAADHPPISIRSRADRIYVNIAALFDDRAHDLSTTEVVIWFGNICHGVRVGILELPPTSVAYENLQFLRSVATGRARAYELVVQGLRKKVDSSILNSAPADLAHIDALINDMALRVNRPP
jgi:hypothetical protein